MAIQDVYLDFWEVFRNEIIGSTNLFIGISLAVIIYFSLKHRISYPVTLLMAGLWLSIIFEKTGIILIWASVLFGAGFIFYFALNKVFGRF